MMPGPMALPDAGSMPAGLAGAVYGSASNGVPVMPGNGFAHPMHSDVAELPAGINVEEAR